MFSNKWIKYGLLIFCLFFFVTYVMELDAYARVGGGRSYGSRGSRSYSSPSSPLSSPTSPSRQSGSPSSYQPSTPPSQSGGFFRNMAGGLVGGMIGGMLFRSLGFGGPGMGGGGIGIFEIIMVGAILYGIWWYIKKRRHETETAYSPAPSFRSASIPNPQQSGFTPSYSQPETGSDIDYGICCIRQMDPSFERQKFKDQSMDSFFTIHGAWANRDISGIRKMFTEEMYRIIQSEADALKHKKQINRLENIAVRKVEISEVWQEGGNDFITVRFTASLLDYTTDEATGAVISGSKTDPVKFEEYWTFTRHVGSNPWQLSAINQI
jgi:predicted lipid-binding transport protein (Tim44 family)